MDKKDYLEISKASDIENKKERMLYRFLEMIPSILSLGTLAGVFVFSWILPSWVAIFIICFCFYYLFKVLYFSLHQITGYLKVKKHIKTDWLMDLKKIKDPLNRSSQPWKKVYHLVILPHYKEGFKIVK